MPEIWDREKTYAAGARVLHMGWAYEALRGTCSDEPFITTAWRCTNFDEVAKRIGAIRDAARAVPVKGVMVQSCARCGRDHHVDFEPLINAPDEWQWWGMCPTVYQPIWLKFGESEGHV